jgi:hypothetical protein
VTPAVAGKVEEVVRCVGFLPLAIAQAASFMMEAHKTLDDLLDLYRGEHKIEVRLDFDSLTFAFSLLCAIKILNWESNLSSYEAQSVAATFASQLEDLENQSPVVSDFLKILSFFDPESTPLTIVIQGAKAISEASLISIFSQPTKHPRFTVFIDGCACR